MKRFVLTQAATADLPEIKDYLSKNSRAAARRVVADIHDAIDSLASSPGIGHRHQDLDEAVRVWQVYAYLIAYLPAPSPLQILRIVHGARDLTKIVLFPPEAPL
jgi:plasmid stabilization system protein ParE